MFKITHPNHYHNAVIKEDDWVLVEDCSDDESVDPEKNTKYSLSAGDPQQQQEQLPPPPDCTCVTMNTPQKKKKTVRRPATHSSQKKKQKPQTSNPKKQKKKKDPLRYADPRAASKVTSNMDSVNDLLKSHNVPKTVLPTVAINDSPLPSVKKFDFEFMERPKMQPIAAV